MAIIFVSGNDTLKVLGFKGTHKIDIVKTLAIITTSGSDTLKVLGFKATHKNCLRFPYDVSVLCHFDDVCQNIRQGVDIYWNIDPQKAKKLKRKQRRKE